jgi:hypothetical protein
MVDNYKQLFGESPSHRLQSPLESNDHPEIDSSKFLGEDDVQKYQSLIGAGTSKTHGWVSIQVPFC